MWSIQSNNVVGGQFVMSESFPNWIEERMIKGVKGFNLDAYVMALEGWRRGLSLTWYFDPSEVTDMKIIGYNPLGKTFSLHSDKNSQIHYFYRSRGDKVANEAVEIVHDKHVAKTYFEKSAVPTPNGVMFHKSLEDDEIIKLVKKLHYPLVVKPTLGSLGKGVVTDIQNETELLESIEYVRESYDYDDIIVEEHVQGEEYRVYVVGDEVVAATNRVPANVVGDGIHTIEELINEKNQQRKENHYLAKKLIQVDDRLLNYLEKSDLYVESIPNKGEIIRLKGQSNISAGGDPIDVTDDISNEIKQTAIQAVKAIPELIHAGVDVIATEKEAVIIEVNATADIAMHLFPMEGKSRNVPEHIIDYYFPETKGMAKDRTRIYFDYNDIRDVLRNKFAQELALTDAPNGKLHTARYIVSGKVQKVSYRAWIRRQAIRKGLHGYTRNLKNGRVVVVVGSHDKETVENFKKTCMKGPSRAKVKRVKELEWDSPIKLGFEIRKTE